MVRQTAKREYCIDSLVPIDKNYRVAWTVVDTHSGHSVWSPDRGKTIVHGTRVGVLVNDCTGCMKCLDVCSVNVFESWVSSKGEVADPSREDDCILCLVCETICPEDAIDIEQGTSSETTLDSLLNQGG
ncbi:MAG: ferredoxin [Candidatus Thorarchaeota archaeon]|nr:MAG: ferredoxin [Candidatus Thorarchaeota archaeon]